MRRAPRPPPYTLHFALCSLLPAPYSLPPSSNSTFCFVFVLLLIPSLIRPNEKNT